MKTTSFLTVIIVCFCINLVSCARYYRCTLNSRGSSPLEKTYYVVSPNSIVNATLEFKEYAGFLKKHLNEIGYTESNPHHAAVRIELDYAMNNAHLTSKYAVDNHINTKSNTNTITIENRTGQQTFNEYQIASSISLAVYIKAFDNKSGEPIWEVNINDELKRETQLQSTMYWLLLSAKDYIGRSSEGERIIRIDKESELASSNFLWK